MGLSKNKILIITIALVPPMLLFCHWIQNHFQKVRTTMSMSTSRKYPNQRKKFFTMLFINHRFKIVYVDNDNTENTPRLTKELTRDTNSANKKNEDIENSSYYNASHGETDKKSPSSIEWDETIEYNYNENVGIPRKTCSDENPSNTIVLVKPRHSPKEPFTNIMYRYGDLNQLTFGLPKRTSFESYWPLRFHPSFIDSSLVFTTRVRMLINSPYCYSTMKRYVSEEALFIAVIYDPVKVYLTNQVQRLYLRKGKPKTILKKLENLLQTGKINDDQYTNTIAFDLGYPLKRIREPNITAKEFIHELETQFDLILIGDNLDESLVVLKKMLCWTLRDFVFIPRKEENLYKNISNHLKLMIKARNKIDQAIYEHFNQTLWEKVKSYGPEFVSDLEELRRVRTEIVGNCSRNAKTSESPRNFESRVNTENIEPLCKTMKWSEREYISYLKRKPPSSVDNELMDGLKHLEDSLYTFFNTTSKEILKLESL